MKIQFSSELNLGQIRISWFIFPGTQYLHQWLFLECTSRSTLIIHRYSTDLFWLVLQSGSADPRHLVRCNLSLQIIRWRGRLCLRNLLHNSSLQKESVWFSLENCTILWAFVFANNNK